jgi:hypothetical protein
MPRGGTQGKCPTKACNSEHSYRRGTWLGKMVVLAKSFKVEPKSTRDCWLIESKGESYPTFKVGSVKGGGQRNRRLHVVFYALLVEKAKYLLPNSGGGELLRHRCGNGWGKHRFVCVNPWHLIKGTSAQNADDRGCKFGSKALCPHKPKCIFNNYETGEPIPCLQSRVRVRKCTHDPRCYPRSK